MMNKHNDKKVYVTRHGRKRSRQRLGISKSSVSKNAEKAFQFGVKHSEATGKLEKYFTNLYFYSNDLNKGHEVPMNNIRIYNRKVYLFAGTNLVSIIDLPKQYYGAVEKILKRRNEQIEQEIKEEIDTGEVELAMT